MFNMESTNVYLNTASGHSVAFPIKETDILKYSPVIRAWPFLFEDKSIPNVCEDCTKETLEYLRELMIEKKSREWLPEDPSERFFKALNVMDFLGMDELISACGRMFTFKLSLKTTEQISDLLCPEQCKTSCATTMDCYTTTTPIGAD